MALELVFISSGTIIPPLKQCSVITSPHLTKYFQPHNKVHASLQSETLSSSPKVDLWALERECFQIRAITAKRAMFLPFITKVYYYKDKNKTFNLAGHPHKVSVINNSNIFIAIHKLTLTSYHINNNSSVKLQELL